MTNDQIGDLSVARQVSFRGAIGLVLLAICAPSLGQAPPAAPPGQPAPSAVPPAQPAPPAQPMPPVKAEPPAADAKAAPPDLDPGADESQLKAAKESIEELKKARSAKAKQEKPARKVSRNEHIVRPGAIRERIPDFREGKVLPVESLSSSDNDRFEKMRQGKEAVDPRIIDRAAKYYAYRLTARNQADSLSKLVFEVLSKINTARWSGQSQPNQEFIRPFKASLTRYLRDVLKEGSLVARINAMLLLTQLVDASGFRDPVAVFVEVLKDKKQQDAIVFLALKGLDRAEELRAVQVEEEREAVDEIFSRIESGDVQSVLYEKMVVTLGTLGRAFRSNQPSRGGVGTFLANIAVDPTAELRLRAMAGIALANLRTRESSIQWNYDLQGLVLARLVRDLVKERNSGRVGEDRFRYWMTQLAETPALGRGGDERLRQLADIVGELRDRAGKGDALDLTKLEDWIAARQPPKNLKLAPAAEDVQWPGAGADAKVAVQPGP